MLSRVKTTHPGEGFPSGRKWGAWIGSRVIFKSNPPHILTHTHCAQASVAVLRLSWETVLQLLRTQQHAGLKRGQTSVLRGAQHRQFMGG